MQVVELFSGWQPLSNEFMRRGHDAVTVDDGSIDGLDVEEAGTDIVADILELESGDLPDDADVVWASPPCKRFSRANQYENWDREGKPKNEETIKGCRLALKALQLIHKLEPQWWFLENPRGNMRRLLDRMIEEPADRSFITYCQYGFSHMKPTDLWGRHPPSFKPKRCTESSKCHAENPDGGINLKGYEESPAERSKLPQGLVKAVVDACEEPYRGVPQQQDLAEVVE